MLTHRRTMGRAVEPLGRLAFLSGVAAAAMLFAFTSGCLTYQPLNKEVTRAVGNWHRPAVQYGMEVSGRHSGAPAAVSPIGAGRREQADSEEHGCASLSQLELYIQDALERNPSVLAAVADTQAKLERVSQATSLPDPIFRAAVRPEPIRTAAGDVHFTLSVAQKIPLLARLDHAGRAATAEVRMAIERLDATRLRVIADVEQAYHRLYLTERSIELTEAHRRSLEDLGRVLATQYRVGKAEQHDLLRIQTEIAKLGNDLARMADRRASAAAALNRLMDYPPARKLSATGPISVCTLAADVEELMALAVEHNPELAILVRRERRDREKIELAELAYWPDPTIGFEWTAIDPRDAFTPPNAQPAAINRMSETGTDSWAVMLQFSVPIWFERIEAAKREARLMLRKTQHEKHATLNTIAFRIFDACERVQTQRCTIDLLESTLIPQARQTYDVSLTAYQAGKSNFLTVIDNWRRLLDFELMVHRAIAQLETTFSQLQHDVGLELIRNETTPKTEQQGEQP